MADVRVLTQKLFQNEGLHDTLTFDSCDGLTSNSLIPSPSVVSLHAQIWGFFGITFICYNRCAWQEDVVNK